jgi:SulP family sulfate permease
VAWRAILAFANAPHWSAAAIAVAVTAVMLVGARLRPGLPFSLLAVAAATAVTALAHLGLARIGTLPTTLPAPSLTFLHPAALPLLATSALAVAALAALESLLSATVADGMTVGQHHDPDRELFGQGVANLVTPLFGGVPATAAIARTAVNVRTGGRSRLAALTHAVVLAAIMLAAAPLVAYIPLAALAGVLLATAIRMIEVSSLHALVRSTRSDALLMALTAVATVALDLVSAVGIGLIVAAFLAIRKIAQAASLQQVQLDTTDHSPEEAALLAEHIVAYRLDGPLFFAAAHRFLLQMSEISDVRAVILRMSRVSTIDATGASVLRDAIDRLEHRGIIVYLSGIRTEHTKALAALGVLDRMHRQGRIFTDTPQAIAAAHAHMHRSRVSTPAAPVNAIT